MKQALVLLCGYSQRFSLIGDLFKPRRWVCFWFGHKEDRVPAMLSYHWRTAVLEKWRQTKTRIELPACSRCKRILDYDLSVGGVDSNLHVENATINVGTIT